VALLQISLNESSFSNVAVTHLPRVTISDNEANYQVTTTGNSPLQISRLSGNHSQLIISSQTTPETLYTPAKHILGPTKTRACSSEGDKRGTLLTTFTLDSNEQKNTTARDVTRRSQNVDGSVRIHNLQTVNRR
jgi:hypothetical protein